MSLKILLFWISLIILTSINAVEACVQTSKWARTAEPILRDWIPEENYEATSDPHVFSTEGGELAMIYSGDDQGQISVKLARLNDKNKWEPHSVLLGLSHGHVVPLMKETPFYRLSHSGEHQIYFIGYEDEETYDSQLFMAVSNTLEGPYKIKTQPIVSRGLLAGKQVHLITSPSVVEHEGQLWLAFLAWDDFENVKQVWVMGAVSDDDGQTWQNPQIIDVPIGMEGQITKTPDGRFLAARTGNYHGTKEAIYISCADHPFGPYTEQEMPALIQKGAPWEVHEIIAPMVYFDAETKEPTLYYTGANHMKGWWVMSAHPVSNK